MPLGRPPWHPDTIFQLHRTIQAFIPWYLDTALWMERADYNSKICPAMAVVSWLLSAAKIYNYSYVEVKDPAWRYLLAPGHARGGQQGKISYLANNCMHALHHHRTDGSLFNKASNIITISTQPWSSPRRPLMTLTSLASAFWCGKFHRRVHLISCFGEILADLNGSAYQYQYQSVSVS